ncbi:trigger factor [Adlercreutzia sp. ZJ141]|uniref:trigger factor n=1 Tax=Adlercreutzia sp. ZJ141 TaxID=2709406 RepID=UPI001F155CFA|nr:trigger factor [Adlercreutzia sp. ZJ141]
METKVEAMEGNRAKVTVTIEAADVDAGIKKTYKEFANRYNFPGFRKGRAPRPVIDNMLGKDAVRAAVTDELVNTNYPLAIDASGLYPMGQPAVNADELVKAGAPYEFTVEFDRIPDFELTSYEPVEIELPSEEVTDDEVDEQIEEFREQLSTLEDASANAKVKADSVVDIAIKATDDDGEELPTLTSESRTYALGSDMLPAEFDEQLVGLKKGQDVSFTIDMPAEPPILLRALSGKTEKIAFEVKVNVVKKRVLPEVTDEWAKENNFESVEDLRTRVHDGIESQKKMNMPALKEGACLAKLAERLEGDIPETLCEQQEGQLLQNFFQQLQMQGLTFDMYLAANNLTTDQFKDDVKKQAADITRQDMALDAWARHNEYVVTSEEVSAEFAKSGAEDPKELEKEWTANGQLHMVRQGILRSRAAMELMDGAVVTETKPAKKKAAKKAAKKADEATEKAE